MVVRIGRHLLNIDNAETIAINEENFTLYVRYPNGYEEILLQSEEKDIGFLDFVLNNMFKDMELADKNGLNLVYVDLVKLEKQYISQSIVKKGRIYSYV